MKGVRDVCGGFWEIWSLVLGLDGCGEVLSMDGILGWDMRLGYWTVI